MPVISVIVPVYKVEPYLRRCVDSILAQTFKDFELILVDDGSPDNCPSICDEYSQQDNRIKVIHQKNHGQAYARNVGIDMAMADDTCQYIAFIDSDDWVTEDYLASLLDAMTDDVDISVCHYCLTDGNNVLEDTGANVQECQNVTGREGCRRMMTDEPVSFVVPWGKLFRKTILLNIRFPQLPKCEDEAVAHRFFYKSRNIAFLPQSLYYYFTNPSSVMHGNPFSERDYISMDAIRGRILFFEEHQEDELASMAKQFLIMKLYNFFIFSKRNKDLNALHKQIKKEILALLANNMNTFPILPYRKVWGVKYGDWNPIFFVYCCTLYICEYGIEKVLHKLRLIKSNH